MDGLALMKASDAKNNSLVEVEAVLSVLRDMACNESQSLREYDGLEG